MTTHLSTDAPIDEPQWTVPASEEQTARTLAALLDNGFAAELLDNTAAAAERALEIIPPGASVFTAASETLQVSGLDADINTSGRYDAVKPRLWAMDRATHMPEIRRMSATPDVVIGSVSALTETGTLVAVSASGSQLPAYAGGAGTAIWIIGTQKIVPDLATAFERIESYALPLESARCQVVYGRPSAINKVLIINREIFAGRSTVLLVNESLGY